METSTSYFFDRAELFCFLPLVKILNVGLPNELQNTRGRQSKNSLSHFIFPEDNRHNCILLRGFFFNHLKQRFSLIIAHLCVAEFKGHSRVPVFVIILF